jgi:3-mercaptopyruvate sulfurtransferase SseA
MGIVTRAALLVLLGGGLGLGAHLVRPAGLSLMAFRPAATCSTGHPAVAAVETLAPAEAAHLCQQPGVLIADARPPQRYAEGHVVDAVHLPCAASGSDVSSVVDRLETMKMVIVYGDTTEEARPVAQDLSRRIGRPDLRVVVLEGGFPAWNQAGLACASGPCNQCAASARP